VDEDQSRGLAFVVEEPGGPHNRFEADKRSNAIVLTGVDLDVPFRSYERGYMADAFGPDGAPIAALVPARVPTFPGCRIRVRPIGMSPSTRRPGQLIVAVPMADSAFDRVAEVDDLPEPIQSAVRAELRCGALGSAETRAYLASVHETTLRLRAAARTGSGPAAWKTGGRTGAIPREGAIEPHTMAERAVPLLPIRFQEYIARELVHDERILMFIQRPAFAPAGTRLVLRRRRLPEAILVLTDRQLMFMADALDPDSTLVHWGYVAQVTAVERIAGATIREDAGAHALEVLVEAKGGTQVLAFPFLNDDAAALLSDAVELLNRFVASPSMRKLRRLYEAQIPPSADTPAWAAESARGAGSLWAETRHGDKLVVDGRSMRVSRKERPEDFASLEIAEVTSLELTLALTGCRLAAFAPAHSPVVLDIDFDYPQASEFLAIFTVLRQLLDQPLESTCHEHSEAPR